MRWVAKYKDGSIVHKGSQRYAELNRRPDVLELVGDDGNVVESIAAEDGRVPFYRIRTVMTPSGLLVGRVCMVGWRRRDADAVQVEFTVIYADGRKEHHTKFEGVLDEPKPWFPFERV